MKAERRKRGMRFGKRLGVVLLSMAMLFTSVQLPGGTAYAAGERNQLDSATVIDGAGQKEGEEPAGGDQAGEDAPADDSHTGEVLPADGSQTGEGAPAGSGQTGDGTPADGSQTGDGTPADGSQTGEGAPAGSGQTGEDTSADDSQTGGDTSADDQTDTAAGDETDSVSDNDSGKPAPDGDEDEEEEPVDAADMVEPIEFIIDGAYQFGGAPAEGQDSGRLTTLYALDFGYSAGLDTYLYQEMQKRTEIVDISSYNVTDVSDVNRVVSGVLNEHPELYYVGSSWTMNRDGNGKVLSVTCTYTDGYDDAAFQTAASEALACIDDGMSDYAKAAALHDYLAVNVAYDYDNLQANTVPTDSYNAYGALVDGVAVCQGYALAYKYLLGKAGIESYMVTSQSMKHAWNMVKIDGKYYHVDVTWDDPAWDMTGRACHAYLLRSDANIDAASSSADKHKDWTVTFGSDVVDYHATDTAYESAFWTKSTAPLVFDGDGCYYITEGGSLNKADFSNPTGTGTELVNIGNWPVWGGSGTWPGAFSGLYRIDGRLYYNDAASIYSIQTDGTDKRTEFTADTSDGYLYGSAYRRGVVYYCLHQNPNLTGKETVLTAELTGGSEEPGVEVDPPIPPQETEEGYNIDNPEIEYPRYGSTRKVTTKASVLGKILIFHRNDDTCKEFFKDMKENLDWFSSTQIVTIALDEYGWDDPNNDHNRGEAAVYAPLGNDLIVDSVEAAVPEGSDLAARAAGVRTYVDAIKDKNSSVASTIDFPFIIYIDGYNKIQYAQRQKTSAFQVLQNFQRYCGYSKYAISYDLGSGTNAAKNPRIRLYSDEVKLCRPYYRENYWFDGWYLDRAYTKKITYIPKGTESNVTLYAKWIELGGGYDAENLTQEYTAADGAKLSSTADGIPKLLVFWPDATTSEGEKSKETLDGIQAALEADPAHVLSGVDIYAVCTSALTEEKVKEYQEKWSRLKVVGENDWDLYYNDCAAYQEAAGYGGDREDGWTLCKPIICYIDAQNRLQYLSIGGRTKSNNRYSTAAAVSDIVLNLQLYCKYPFAEEGFYQINYVMNGGTNDGANPPRYHRGMANIPLQDPVQESSRRFDGWYLDAAFTERITEIDTSIGGDITVYAKWKKNGFGFTSRREYTWTALDGSELSSHADGKPKLLIFGNYNCGLSEATVKAVAGRSEWFRGADVYYISVYDEPENAGADAPGKAPTSYVEQLKEDCGTDAIIFTKGGGDGGGGDPLQPYMWCLDTGCTLALWPNIVYIDKDDKIQYMSVGNTAKGILDWLREYCDYDMSLITYEMNGGTNDSENPATYTMETETITLKDPVKEGYTFDGWYKDAAFTRKVTQIAKGSSGDITLYAKWEGSVVGPETYRITYELDGGTNDSENPVTYTMETETITLKDPVKEGYIFEGWYKDAAFKEKVAQIVKGSTGDITLYAKWREAEFIFSVRHPEKTTYKVSQELDVTGGKIILTRRADNTREEKDMEPDMLTGFDSSKPGICTVTVTFGDYKGSFDTLIVEEPKVTVVSGEKLGSARFPKSDYGTYVWADDVDPEKVLNDIDVYTYGAVFIPNDTEKFQTLTDLQVQVQVARRLTDACAKIEFLDGPYRYIGEQIRPKVKVTYTDSMGNTVTLIEGQDYELSCSRENLFEVGGVIVSGINEYTDEIERDFEITRAVRTIRVLDKVILVGSEIPTDFEYEIVGGLYGDDQLFTEPEFRCGITSTAEEGEYEIKANGADADFYMFHYEPGTLYVVSEPDTCKVTFDVQGHGTAPRTLAGIRTGATIDSPEEPAAEGYRFDGWYKDTACTLVWDFENDTVQSDLTLYAKWLAVDNDGEFAVQEIADVYYTGKAQKPAISVYDENKLLKAGKDYTVRYYNNINANAGGALRGEEFDPDLPYVAITGKGNYKETVKINFNILRAPLDDGAWNPAAGVTLKVNDHLVKGNKVQRPFGSLKKGRTLKLDKDYDLTLKPVYAQDASGKLLPYDQAFTNAAIPANCTGEFQLTVRGIGNYTGSISRSVYVADKAHLMKNVKIILGSNVKKGVAYTGSKIELTAAEKQKPANDEFVVAYGRTVLKPGEDYVVSYRNNVSAGKAELIVTGKGAYTGRKTANFNIKGKTFTNGTVTVKGLEDQVYTGRAAVQNQNAVLTWKADGTKLVYGQDYTISYSRNINKGTATITFTGRAEAGYSGRISKKFKIGAANIADINRVMRAGSMNAIILPYSKAGVKPVDEIILTNERGTRLRLGKDYTLAYKNNKAVAGADAGKAPTVTVKGKGNYSGTFDVKFTIEKADLNRENITIECAQVAYNSKKPDSYVYKPAIKVKDDKMALKAGRDYEIAYDKNTQADCKNYVQNLINNQLSVLPVEGRAMAVITEKEGSAYSLQEPIRIPLEIYQEKLKKNNLSVQIDMDAAVYTGRQVRPKVTVTYKTEGGSVPLEEGVDYTLVYGANIASGKNKGSVTVKGLAPDYGGSVTYKFEIIRKDLKYWDRSVTDDEK